MEEFCRCVALKIPWRTPSFWVEVLGWISVLGMGTTVLLILRNRFKR